VRGQRADRDRDRLPLLADVGQCEREHSLRPVVDVVPRQSLHDGEELGLVPLLDRRPRLGEPLLPLGCTRRASLAQTVAPGSATRSYGDLDELDREEARPRW
jgi:hypothetical protein